MPTCDFCGTQEGVTVTGAGSACNADYPKLKRRKAQGQEVALVSCSNCGERVPPAGRCIRCGEILGEGGEVARVGD